MNYKSRWAVILAGGDGTRLKTLTRMISGDDRPKQFCAVIGGTSLLAQTRIRLATAISTEQTVFVVVKTHKRYYERELANVNHSRILVQPTNKGTTPAILWSLLRIARSDENAIVGFFPTDHYYAEDAPLTAAVDSAFEMAQAQPDALILLGAEPQHAEVEYGWIEPSVALNCGIAGPFFRVSRVWEKPSLPLAQALLGRGCLWNTFVMIGRVRTFLAMLTSAVPGVLRAFESIARQYRGEQDGMERLDCLYATLASGDFSRQVLSVCTDKLAVLRLGNVGWSDLGTPQRVIATMARAETASDTRQNTAYACASRPNIIEPKW